MEANLNGAHDSLVDERAQTDILTHSSFVPFIDRASSIQPIDEIFSRTLQNEWKKNMEPTRPVHAPWVELTKEHDIKWEPSWQDKYTGPQGGPPAGPTQFIVDIVRSAKGLADIFFAILLLAQRTSALQYHFRIHHHMAWDTHSSRSAFWF